tara:strand:- start:4 stop:120 length:117 start_codon:yes stop_codon:yes gene_type:complete
MKKTKKNAIEINNLNIRFSGIKVDTKIKIRIIKEIKII